VTGSPRLFLYYIDRVTTARRAALAALLSALLAACGGGASRPATPSTAAPTAAAPAAPAVAAAASPAASPTAPPQVTVRFAGQPSAISDAGIILAQERGYFAEQGIVSEREVMQAAPQALPPLATGQLEMAAFAPNAALLNALGRGIAVKLVADKGREGPGFAFQSLVLRPQLMESGAMQSLADLRGRRIALPSIGSTLTATLAAGLAPYGLTMEDLQIETMTFPDMVPAVANGSVDGAVLIEPITTDALGRGAVALWRPVWELYPEQAVAVIMYGPNMTERDPDLGRRWMLAYLRGVRLYNDAYARNDPAVRAAVTETLAAATRVAPGLVEQIAAAGRLPGLEPNGRMNADALRDAGEYWRQSGTLTSDITMDQLLDNRFTDYAVQQLGPYR
jgi:NitT/TauT family transport system substrate-binding protein